MLMSMLLKEGVTGSLSRPFLALAGSQPMLETARGFKDTLLKGGRFNKLKRNGHIEELVMRGMPLKETVEKGPVQGHQKAMFSA